MLGKYLKKTTLSILLLLLILPAPAFATSLTETSAAPAAYSIGSGESAIIIPSGATQYTFSQPTTNDGRVSWSVPQTGYYAVELSGGTGATNGGKATGQIYLIKDTVLYIYAGGDGGTGGTTGYGQYGTGYMAGYGGFGNTGEAASCSGGGGGLGAAGGTSPTGPSSAAGGGGGGYGGAGGGGGNSNIYYSPGGRGGGGSSFISSAYYQDADSSTIYIATSGGNGGDGAVGYTSQGQGRGGTGVNELYNPSLNVGKSCFGTSASGITTIPSSTIRITKLNSLPEIRPDIINNSCFSEVAGYNQILISGNVIDADNDNVTVYATVKKGTQTVFSGNKVINQCGTGKPFSFQFVLNQYSPEGTYDIDLWANDGK